MALVDADRIINDLRTLDELTSNERGAQRVAWTATWRSARDFYRSLLAELGLEPEQDEAGNLWTYVHPGRDELVVVGSHLDSVPDGGWLDGALGVMTGVGLARATRGTDPERGLALVDFADEEGARFGRSLVGSSAVSGSLRPMEVGELVDSQGLTMAEAMKENGLVLANAPAAAARIERAVAYLELHIEQGPVLEREGADIGVVEGVLGVERMRITVRGGAGHAGATPMRFRRDPLRRFADAFSRICASAESVDGLATVGALGVRPGVATIVPAEVEFVLDVRAPDREALDGLVDEARGCLEAGAGFDARVEPIWSMEPTRFDAALVDLGAKLAPRHGRSLRLLGGPGHDAVEIARRVPTAMIFAPSKEGLSHVAEEDTDPEQLARAIRAFGELVSEALG